MSFKLFALAALSILPLAACGAPDATDDGAQSDDATSTTYSDLSTKLTGADLAAWNTAKAGLVNGFYNICGDTYCGGDYANLTPIDLACSVTELGHVKTCTWAFAGSEEYVDPTTGAFVLYPTEWSCKIPVNASSKDFLAALANGDPLNATIAGQSQSFYDAIGPCLGGLQGHGGPSSDTPAYGEMFDVTMDQGGWDDGRNALNGEFESACGKTFCASTSYPAIAPLRFVCAADIADQTVKSCAWSFIGTTMNVTTKGDVTAHTKTWECTIPIHGTMAAVDAALTTGTSAYTKKLPGMNKGIATVLKSCIVD